MRLKDCGMKKMPDSIIVIESAKLTCHAARRYQLVECAPLSHQHVHRTSATKSKRFTGYNLQSDRTQSSSYPLLQSDSDAVYFLTR